MDGPPPSGLLIRSVHRHALRQSLRRGLRRGLVASVLPGLLLLQACGLSRFQPGQTLHVVVVPVEQMAWLDQDYRDLSHWQPLIQAFRRFHPGVSIDLSVVGQNALAETLRRGSGRGLAPDLLLLRSPLAVTLAQQGLVAPLPLGDPAVRRAVAMVQPRMLEQVRLNGGLAALPALSEPTLACYDRRRLPQAPATLADLLRVAASGHGVGLAVDPVGLWWSAGALGAEEVLMKSLIGVGSAAEPVQPAERLAVQGWLTWLRQAALQSRVELSSGQQDLVSGLENGALAWIPCFSLSLNRLGRRLGPHLGVATLPAGPAGPPSPFIASRSWALGLNSSPRQRRLALELATLSLNPLVQRDAMLASRTILPANKYVAIPVASSGRLQVMAQALEEANHSPQATTASLSIERLERVIPPLETAVTDGMVGLMTPAQAADILVNLRYRR